MNDQGCSAATRNNGLVVTRTFLKYAANIDVTIITFLEELKTVHVKKPNVVGIIDYMAPMAVTAVLEEANTSASKGLCGTFMVLMYDTGERIQEMIDIKFDNLCFSKTLTITIHGKGRKVRSFSLVEKTVQQLQKYIAVFQETAYSLVKLEKKAKRHSSQSYTLFVTDNCRVFSCTALHYGHCCWPYA